MEKTVSTKKAEMLVKDVMLQAGDFPVLTERVIFKEALEAMSKTRLGIACVVDKDKHLLGVITDGDVRRKLLTVQKPFSAFFVDDCIEHCIKSPKVTTPDANLISAIELMEKYQIWDLPVVNEADELAGLLHLHPAIKAVLGMS